MLAALKFVQGSVAKKELVEGLTHFRIVNGTVRGFNGVIALCSPIDLDLDCTPLADPMVKAINNCEDTVNLIMRPNGKLNIKSGRFSVNIECTDKETPYVEPEGEMYPINGETVIAALTALQPFVSNDASRPWSCGILLDGSSALATNNVTIAEYWLGGNFPRKCAIPRLAIREILRIKEIPTHIQACEKNITFHYASGRWIRSQLLKLEWPDLTSILNIESAPTMLDETLFTALENIKPFTDKIGRIYIENGTVRTHYEESEGASYQIQDSNMQGIFNLDIMLLLKGVATQADMKLWPKACTFFGNNLRGVLMGYRQ